MQLRRSGTSLKPNNARVVFRPFEFSESHRSERVISRVMERTEGEVDKLLSQVLSEFHGRHQRLKEFFLERFEAVKHHVLTDRNVSETRRMLIGSYFTQEYALESAALFNPSMVAHPDQTGVPAGALRFVLSLRATGEGHISSICFRSGIVRADGEISVDKPTGFVTPPGAVPNVEYDKVLFGRKLAELHLLDGLGVILFEELGDQFTLTDLELALDVVLRRHGEHRDEWEPLGRAILALARSNYEIQCDPRSDISERVLFPYSPTESNGIEDARFVRFTEGDSVRYFATYTAYDGHVIFPQMVETKDFLHFRVTTLNGPEVSNKGMALFPRKINGRYAMLSRQDGENLYLMYSDMRHFWYRKTPLLRPTEQWEFVQIGNCGSPIETDAGWLVLTHGVGPMRKYSIGAVLLDLEDPSRVIGRLPEPLLSPDENERAGYVPNVVYSCGGLVHNGLLIIPYAMSDYASSFATVELQDLISEMTRT